MNNYIQGVGVPIQAANAALHPAIHSGSIGPLAGQAAKQADNIIPHVIGPAIVVCKRSSKI